MLFCSWFGIYLLLICNCCFSVFLKCGFFYDIFMEIYYIVDNKEMGIL